MNGAGWEWLSQSAGEWPSQSAGEWLSHSPAPHPPGLDLTDSTGRE
ncbi:hypothetical protein [Streptomyces sp. NPDC005374]